MADQKFEIEIGARIDALERGLKKASAELRKLKDQTDQTQASSRKFGEALSSIQTIVTRYAAGVAAVSAAAAASIVAIAAAGLKAASQFESAMSESLAIMGPLSDATKRKLEDTARSVAKTTRFSAEQAAQSYYFLASAGLDAAQSMAALPKVAQFAQAGLLDMAKATELLMDSQSALGLRSADAAENTANLARVSDVLTLAAVRSNASIEQFAQALTNKAAPAMRNLGIEVEQGVAVLAAYADQGIKGQIAGERFDIMLRELTGKAMENRDAFASLGIEVFDSSGKLNNLAAIVGQIEKAFTGMSAQQKLATLDMLGFTAESRTAILNLVGMSDKIREYEAALKSAGGATGAIAAKQMESLAARFELAKKAIHDVFITIGQALMPAIERIMVGVPPLIEGFQRFGQALLRNKEVIAFLAEEGFAALVTALDILFTLLGKFVGVLPRWIHDWYVTKAALLEAAAAIHEVQAAMAKLRGDFAGARVASGIAERLKQEAQVARQFVKDFEKSAQDIGRALETAIGGGKGAQAAAGLSASFDDIKRAAAGAKPPVASLGGALDDFGGKGKKARSAAQEVAAAIAEMEAEARRATALQALMGGPPTGLIQQGPELLTTRSGRPGARGSLGFGSPFQDLLGTGRPAVHVEGITNGVIKATKATVDWSRVLEDVRNAFDVLGISAGSALGSILGGLAAAGNAGQRMAAALKGMFGQGGAGFSIEGAAQFATGMLQVVGAFMAATDKRSSLARAFGGAAVGAQVGGEIGQAVGGPMGRAIGAGAGAVIGAVAGIFRRPGWTRAAQEAGRLFGQWVSDQLAKEIEKRAKELGISFRGAALLSIQDQMRETGKSAHDMGAQIMELMGAVSRGMVPAKQGLKELGELFSQVAKEAQQGVGDKLLVQMLQTARQLGQVTPEMKEFVSGQLDKAGAGVGAIVGAGGKGGILIVSEADAAAQATIFSAVFWAKVKEQGLALAVESMKPAFDNLKEVAEKAGLDISGVLAPIESVMALMGEKTKPIMDGIAGLQQALGGLADAGYLTTDAFSAIQQQAASAQAQIQAELQAQGQDTATATATSLQAVAPLLAQIQQAAQNYGMQVDANTQALINQAQAAGIAFPVQPMQQVVDVLVKIAEKLGAEIPASVTQSTAAIQGLGAGATTASTQVVTAFGGASQTIIDGFAVAAQVGTDSLANIAGVAEDSFKTLGSLAEDAGGQMKASIEAAGAGMKDALLGTTESLKGEFLSMANVAKDALGGLKEQLASLGGGITVPIRVQTSGFEGLPHAQHGLTVRAARPHGRILVAGEQEDEDVVPHSRRRAYARAVLGGDAGRAGVVNVNLSVKVEGGGSAEENVRAFERWLRDNRGGLRSVLKDQIG